MKKCTKCDKEKDLSEFGKDTQKKDGLSYYCKDCVNKRNKESREKNPEYALKYFKEYREKNREFLRQKAKENFLNNKDDRLKQGRESYHRHKDEIAKKRKIKRQSPEEREKMRIRIKEWREKNKDRFNASVRKWQKSNREKTNAHARVHWAVATGRLIRSETCQECGLNCKTEGHHEDYTKEFDVIWLCRRCHAKKIEKIEV